jgi:hypothetical protein
MLDKEIFCQFNVLLGPYHEPVEFNPLHTLILISSNLHTGLPCGLFPSGILAKILQ